MFLGKYVNMPEIHLTSCYERRMFVVLHVGMYVLMCVHTHIQRYIYTVVHTHLQLSTISTDTEVDCSISVHKYVCIYQFKLNTHTHSYTHAHVNTHLQLSTMSRDTYEACSISMHVPILVHAGV